MAARRPLTRRLEAVRVYDHARDDLHPLEQIVDLHQNGSLYDRYLDGLMGHCASLSSALELLLDDDPSNPSVRAIGRTVLDEFDRWMADQKRQVAALESIH